MQNVADKLAAETPSVTAPTVATRAPGYHCAKCSSTWTVGQDMPFGGICCGQHLQDGGPYRGLEPRRASSEQQALGSNPDAFACSSNSSSSNDESSKVSSSNEDAKAASEDPVGDVSHDQQKEAHREEKLAMKRSAECTEKIQHMSLEQSPDPRASHELRLRQVSEEIRALPTLPPSQGNPDTLCEGSDEAIP